MSAEFWIGMAAGFAVGAVFMFCLDAWVHSGSGG